LVSAIKTVLNKHNLKPVATLVTHGHLDHTFSVRPFGNEYGVPTLIHTIDRKLLTDPLIINSFAIFVVHSNLNNGIL
jgi:glyoxylase-like metal-dependent hydrolase (beta-lactamase superfamily II)